MIRFIIGLGNPGEKYEKTRHNLGRRLIELISREKKYEWNEGRQYDWTDSRPSCVKLNTYMNESGEAVRELVQKFKLNLESILVCTDDFDLPLGTIRIRKKGSPGSHNGLKSLTEHLQSGNFPRLRMGIGPVPRSADPADFVLEPFLKEEGKTVKAVMEKAAEAIAVLLSENIDAAMNKFNA